MGALILWVGKATGLNTLFSAILGYAIIALIAGGSLWGYGLHKYESGKSVGISQERIAWEETRKRELTKQAAQKAADQARIDQIEAEYLLLQQQLDAARADAFLEEAIRKEAQANKPALPKSIARALNGVR